MPHSTALLIEPETAPASETDERPYLIADRTNFAVKSAAVTVGTTAVELTAGLARRRKVYIKSVSTSVASSVLHVGGSGVSTSNGYPIRLKDELWLDLTPGAAIYGIVPSGTANVRVLEAGV
ncbi:MAG: hypothetical protein KJZ69_13780 [Phycisphaerales bacterium]|nr:hypothetical protein [Phycisphaerales bacterium]